MIEGGRQWWLEATAATAFLYLTKAYVATCNGHATRAFVKCRRGDNGDRRRETVVVGSDGSNSILVVNKSLRCIHATAMQRVLLLNTRICGWRKWVPMDKE